MTDIDPTTWVRTEILARERAFVESFAFGAGLSALAVWTVGLINALAMVTSGVGWCLSARWFLAVAAVFGVSGWLMANRSVLKPARRERRKARLKAEGGGRDG